MNTNVGLWIDHRKAVIVTVTDQGAEVRLTISGVEKQLRRAGDSPLKGRYDPRQLPAEDRRQRAFAGHLKPYYDGILAILAEAREILIIGPGEAKLELKKRLEDRHLGDRIVGFGTADKMTTPQIAAKIRKYFAADGM